MIISDLQYIESASEVEVNGGSGYCKPHIYCKPICYKPAYNVASANAEADAYGRNTMTSTSTDTKVVQGESSSSDSSSLSKAF
ncbi:MAG: hypothetical protein RLZZ381_2595 [Cyanobacteriota bacterium]|jgi:hypothetical protein